MTIHVAKRVQTLQYLEVLFAAEVHKIISGETAT